MEVGVGMAQEGNIQAQEDIRKRILSDINLKKVTDDDLERQVREEVDRHFAGTYMSIEDKAFLTDQIFSSIRGLGFWTRLFTMIRLRRL